MLSVSTFTHIKQNKETQNKDQGALKKKTRKSFSESAAGFTNTASNNFSPALHEKPGASQFPYITVL